MATITWDEILREDPEFNQALKKMQEREDREFLEEMKQELGLYLVNHKPVPVEQRMTPPRRKQISINVECAYPQF